MIVGRVTEKRYRRRDLGCINSQYLEAPEDKFQLIGSVTNSSISSVAFVCGSRLIKIFAEDKKTAVYFVIIAIRKFLNRLSAINLTISRHFLKNIKLVISKWVNLPPLLAITPLGNAP